MNDDDKTILTGRIYPAIQSCVNNRYKIIVGYFAVVGFLLVKKDDVLKTFIESGALAFLSIIFTLFVAHNFVNYWCNAQEQQDIEKKHDKEKSHEQKFPVLEVSSSVVMLFIIWSGFCLLKNI